MRVIDGNWHAAMELVPHRHPMLLVDYVRLLEPADGPVDMAEARSLVRTDWPVLDGAGRILPPAMFEIAAQSFAAMAGLRLKFSGEHGAEKRLGFLVALKRFNLYGNAVIGDELVTSVSVSAQLGEFSVVQSEVRLEGTVLAEGQLKVYCPTAGEVRKILGV